MKVKIIVILILISSISNAQNIPAGWTIGLKLAPEYSYRSLSTGNSGYDSIIDLRNSLEEPDLRFHSGFTVSRSLFSKIDFLTGIDVEHEGYVTSKVPVVDSLNEYNAISHKYSYLFIEVPVIIRYYIFRKKVSLFVTAGFTPGVFISPGDIATYYNGDTIKKKEYLDVPDLYQCFNLSGYVGAGIRCDLNDDMGFRISPYYERGLVSIYKNSKIDEYLYSYGLEFCLFYKFLE